MPQSNCLARWKSAIETASSGTARARTRRQDQTLTVVCLWIL